MSSMWKREKKSRKKIYSQKRGKKRSDVLSSYVTNEQLDLSIMREEQLVAMVIATEVQ